MKNLLRRFAFYILSFTGDEGFVIFYPSEMLSLRLEILQLCREEDLQDYATTDILGSGYFRYRRVCTIMKKRYPDLNKRSLSKAVILCSDSIASGQ